MLKNKAFTNYRASTNISLSDPEWQTDSSGMSWRRGGYGAPSIPSGVYRLEHNYGEPPYLLKLELSVDNLIDLPEDPSTRVINHIQDFWDKEPKFRELKFTFKRGILLFGPPGSGKSVTIFRLAALLERENAVMIMAQSAHEAQAAISIVKSVEDNRRIVVVFEDIDGIVRRYGDESMTHLLDGGVDVDNVLFLATTNYPERLPERLLNRPSRFDVLVKISMPNAASREAYIRAVLGDNLLIDISMMVMLTEGFTLAEIKEVIILTQVFDYEIIQAVQRMKVRDLDSAVETEETEEIEETELLE